MALDIRAYDPERDFDAARRIWLETRWLDDDDKQSEGFRIYTTAREVGVEVGLIDGTAECLVHRTPGVIRYEHTDLGVCAITGVTTSHIGRKQGFASTMTARALRHGAESGAAVGLLGMFEQGFYDRFGFGTADYVNIHTFDPQSLQVGHIPYRTPLRLTVDDAADMATALRNRRRSHGGVALDSPDLFAWEWPLSPDAYALGYRDGDGELTHFVIGNLKGENGPFRVAGLAYRTAEQLMELLRLLRELGDQIHAVRMMEPPEVQLQTLIETPMRQRNRSKRSEFETGNDGVAWWQLRVLDVEACVAARRWPGEPVRCNLRLTDPVTDHLDGDGGWTGVGGEYTLEIADTSSAVPGPTDDLPWLTCDVGAFSRLLFGIRPATSLALTDRLDAPGELLAGLDEAFVLPRVVPGMWF